MVFDGGGGRTYDGGGRVHKNLQWGTDEGRLILIIQDSTENGDLKKISPIVISRWVTNNIKTGKLIIRRNDGSFLMSVNEDHIGETIKINKINNINVTISLHKFLNRCRGIIYHPDLELISDDEILQGLTLFKVVQVERIKKYIPADKISVKTGAVILSFQCRELPDYINLEYLRIRVKQYVPDPYRCNLCWDFGHTHKHCAALGNQMCGRCGSVHHGENCTKPLFCLNCQKAGHPAWDRKCARYIKEKSIAEIMEIQRVPHIRALRLYEEKIKEGNHINTYANKVQQIPQQIQQTTPDINNDLTYLTKQIKVMTNILVTVLQKLNIKTDTLTKTNDTIDNNINNQITDATTAQQLDTECMDDDNNTNKRKVTSTINEVRNKKLNMSVEPLTQGGKTGQCVAGNPASGNKQYYTADYTNR